MKHSQIANFFLCDLVHWKTCCPDQFSALPSNLWGSRFSQFLCGMMGHFSKLLTSQVQRGSHWTMTMMPFYKTNHLSRQVLMSWNLPGSLQESKVPGLFNIPFYYLRKLFSLKFTKQNNCKVIYFVNGLFKFLAVLIINKVAKQMVTGTGFLENYLLLITKNLIVFSLLTGNKIYAHKKYFFC